MLFPDASPSERYASELRERTAPPYVPWPGRERRYWPSDAAIIAGCSRFAAGGTVDYDPPGRSCE